MARLFDVNNARALGEWTGKFLFLLKELAVAAGYTVKGSSDGGTNWAYSGITSALAADKQGSGGSYDAWTQGSGSNHSTKTEGDPRQHSWLVLENDGREYLIAPTWSTASFQDGYGRLLYAPKGSGGFDGSVAGLTTLPGAATDEAEVFGTRSSSDGSDMFLTNLEGYVHLFANSTNLNGVLPFGFMCTTSALAVRACFAVAGVLAGTQAPDDDDPCCLFYGSTAFNQRYAWNYGSQAVEVFNLSNDSFWEGSAVVDPVSGNDPIAEIDAYLGSTSNRIYKGRLGRESICWSALNRTFPTILDTGSQVFLYAYSGMLIPWPDISTAPGGASITVLDGDLRTAATAVASGAAPTATLIYPVTKLPRQGTLIVDVTDVDGDLDEVWLLARFADGTYDVVHDGTAFAHRYADSTRQVVSGGFRYSVRRAGGWPSSFTFKARSFDLEGNRG